MGSSTGLRGAEPGGHEEFVQFGRPARRRGWLGSLLLAVLVVVAALAVVLHSSEHPIRPPPPAVAITDVGHPILGIRAGWELFALDGNGLAVVQFSRGRIVRTAVPPLLSDGPVFFVAARGEAIIRPLDNVPGYIVPDGQPAQPLTGLLAHGGTLLPGPTLNEQWFGSTSLELLGPGGKQMDAHLAAVARAWSPFWVAADGAGGVILLDWTSQVEEYDAAPGKLRPVGVQLVAVGPKTWLGMNCESGLCRNVVISAASGASEMLPGPPVSMTPWSSIMGAVAPDGSAAAVFVPSGVESSTLELVSLISATRVRIAVPVGSVSSTRLAWSPDSRWLFVVTANGGLDAVNPRTGRVQVVGLGLSGLSQIAIRPVDR